MVEQDGQKYVNCGCLYIRVASHSPSSFMDIVLFKMFFAMVFGHFQR